MSTDLETRIAALAIAWDDAAAPVTIDELVAVTSQGGIDADRPTVIELDRHEHRRSRVALALGTAAAIAAGLVAVVVTRDTDTVDPVAPSPITTVSGTLPTTPSTTVDTTPGTTASPTTTATTTAPPEDFSVRLAQIDTDRADALRRFETVGFTVRHLTTRPDETVDADTSADVILRNDGSSAVASDSFVWSYYDAITGTARVAFIGGDGQTAYQEVAGQTDNSVALGVPTGLPNGIVEPFPLMPDYVVGVVDDVIDGRPTWRIDSEYESGLTGESGSAGESTTPTTSIWIDVETGVTLQSRSVGMETRNDVPMTDTVTLSNLHVGASLPNDFPGTFPAGAAVDHSGDPTQFESTSLDAAAQQFDVGIVLPTGPADVVALSKMNFGNPDGTTTSSPSLIVRWFDGFLRTEYRVTAFPPSMAMPDSCASCTGSLLDELRSWGGGAASADVTRSGLGISISGPNAQAVQAVIDSLVESP